MGVGRAELLAALAVASTSFVVPAPAPGAPARDIDPARFGAQIDPVTAPAFCSRLQDDGATVSAQFLSRGVMERNDGSLNRSVIDNRVDALLDCGVEVGLRVATGTAEEENGLPDDLGAYTALLTELSAHLAGRVDHFAIDNETAAPSHWPGSAESYFELVRAASAALRAGNPNATVVDGTMASGSMTAVMVDDLYDRGRFDEAIALAQETQANELGGGAPVTDMASLTDYVTSDKVQRFVRFFELLVGNQSHIDAMQLHYYGPWRSLPEMFDFVRDHGVTVPIELWETNHRYKDGRPFVESEHADEVARLLVSGAGEGSSFTVFSSYLGKEENDAYGLLTFDGTGDREARRTFRSVSEAVTGARAAERLSLPGNAWGYRFERPGVSDVTAFWSDPGRAGVGERLGIDATTAAVATAGIGGVRHVRLDRLEAEGTPRFAEPDLVEIAEAGGRQARKAARLRLTCPDASPTRRCAGEVKLTRRGKGRPRKLGSAGYSVPRGESDSVRVRIARHHGKRPKPTGATAVADRCTVRSRGGCRSWARFNRGG